MNDRNGQTIYRFNGTVNEIPIFAARRRCNIRDILIIISESKENCIFMLFALIKTTCSQFGCSKAKTISTLSTIMILKFMSNFIVDTKRMKTPHSRTYVTTKLFNLISNRIHFTLFLMYQNGKYKLYQ
ncbi:Uncharacterised protein [Chlamydia trachomatis]|nr:Uncharacterised protein [Chlamydia trachomatis]